ncbi:serine/threonine-protein kinase 36-like isoform X1 [Haliotis rufescens]|uniref:serine/threonine-protein kinase 36-like isoform X1 n=2 Tax=Haliotis rufescens TaxID=6454 RepID=UPI00201F44DC|nr:serine/threonine-protein kinase 36-like isoform X1 [Haliotis rufescens]
MALRELDKLLGNSSYCFAFTRVAFHLDRHEDGAARMQDERYETLEQIGSGAYGDVYKGRKRGGSGEICALKYISSYRSKKEMNDVRNEILIMQKVNHPHIIKLLDSYEIPGYLVVATECASKELYKTLVAAGCFPEKRVHEIACQLSSAVFYLHANRILHRDLKPENVLLMEDGTVKLCDFGFARAMGETYYATTIKRTPVYMAPEIATESFVSYTEKVDIWALGCIIFELLVGDPPFFSNNMVTLGMKILNSSVPWTNNMPPDLKDLLQMMLIKNPRERCSWPTILSHPWFKGGIIVSPEDRARDSPYTNPDVAQRKAEEHNKKVRILGRGGKLPESEDFADGGEDCTDGDEDVTDGDEDMDVVIMIPPRRRGGAESPAGSSGPDQ